MKSNLHCVCALITAITAQGIFAAAAFGIEEPNGLVFRIPDITVESNGLDSTLGMLDVTLDLTGDYAISPPTIASYNVALELAGEPADVMFGLPQDMQENQLLAAGNVFADATELPHTIRFAKDALTPAAAIDGGVMVSVPFMVNAGVTGRFPIRFVPGNELTNPSAQALPIVLVDGSITVVAAKSPPVGDYNVDGHVDTADYIVWRKLLGFSGANLPADGNGDGEVDDGDYNLWRAGFGQSLSGAATATAAATAIPEPATILSAIVVGVVLTVARHRR
jgi:hypothetical protein